MQKTEQHQRLVPVGVGVFTLADHKYLSHPGICLLAATLNDCVHWGLVGGARTFCPELKLGFGFSLSVAAGLNSGLGRKQTNRSHSEYELVRVD